MPDFYGYEAVSAKVRAMFGRRIMTEDYRNLLHKKSVPDIASYLASHPAYRSVISGINERFIRRSQLETLLRRHLLMESLRIFKQIEAKNRAFFQVVVAEREIEQLLKMIMAVRIGRTEGIIFDVPQYMSHISKVRFDRLPAAKSIRDIVDALRGTPYAKALEPLAADAWTSPAAVERALMTYYYNLFYDSIEKTVTGDVRKALLKFVDSQIDVINITRIIRLKKYFDVPAERIPDYLLPFRGGIKRERLDAIIKAGDVREAYDIIESTRYRSLFSRFRMQNLDDYYLLFIYNTALRAVRMPPSVLVPIAYLFIKEIEIKNLIRIIEGVRYRVSPALIRKNLVGVPEQG